MKSKQNSKLRPNPIKKVSCLLADPQHQSKTYTVPSDLGQIRNQLNVSDNCIESLEGIENCQELIHLNISQNSISDFSALITLKTCINLQSLSITGNPITQQINYIYGILCILNRTITINGIKLDCGITTIKKWQQNNGYKVAQFLLQLCLIVNEKNTKGTIRNISQIRQQLVKVRSALGLQLQQLDKTDKLTIQKINKYIHENFPLKSIIIGLPSSDNLHDVQQYLLDKIIEKGVHLQSNLLEKLLSTLEVQTNQQQTDLIRKPQLVHLLLQNELQRQYRFYESLEQRCGQAQFGKVSEENLKHYISAETALDTLEGEKNWHRVVHFAVDGGYLGLLAGTIMDELERVILFMRDCPEEQKESFDVGSQQYNLLYGAEIEDSLQLNKSGKAVQLLYNSCIMSSIVSMLESTIKKILFRRLKDTESKPILKEAAQMLTTNLQKIVVRSCFFSLVDALHENNQYHRIREMLNKKITFRLFRAWKKLKHKKLKLLKAILSRKSKTETFLRAIAFAKWKLKVRANKIQRMVSAVLVKTASVAKLPVSKKGIQLAYNRVSSNLRMYR